MSDELSRKDPLGEIKRLAKQIWTERNEPTGTTWRNFVSEAEKQLTAGLGRGKDSSEPNRTFITVKSPSLVGQSSRVRFPLLAALMGIPEGLNEHECFCLARFLLDNDVITVPGEPFRQCSNEEIAELLTILAAEYEADNVEFPERCAPLETDLEILRTFWIDKVCEWRDSDPPLNNSDRNTIERLRDGFLRSGAFSECRLRQS